eukprot:COSAG06_NODE_65620_length_256_cov_0.993631_1_plen_22_part_01
MGGIFCGLPLLTALAVGCGAKV